MELQTSPPIIELHPLLARSTPSSSQLTFSITTGIAPPPFGQRHNMPQDLPPTGGYEAVQYKVRMARSHTPPAPNQKANRLPSSPQRNIPTRGLKPAYYLLGVGLVMAYGWRKIFIGAREKKYGFLICSRLVPLTPSPPAPTCQPALFLLAHPPFHYCKELSTRKSSAWGTSSSRI